MIDKPVAIPLDDGRIRYDIGLANWDVSSGATRQIPVLVPGTSSTLGDDDIIDIVILGDGYQTRQQFESVLDEWMDGFFAVAVHKAFASAFRIRALFTPSDEPASASRGSHYRVKIDDDGVTTGGWWNGLFRPDQMFRRRLFASLEEFADLDWRRYPPDLDTGGGDTVLHDDLPGMVRNTVVSMLVQSADDDNVSGRCRAVNVPDAVIDDEDRAVVNVAFGAHPIHELGHALVYLEDEYIRDRAKSAKRDNPESISVFTQSNLSFSEVVGEVPWAHLSPWGLVPRQGAGRDLQPLVGWMWRGGEQDLDVWHAEYQCLMNGQSQNYRFAPTDELDVDGLGEKLRTETRFCLWCQEIVVLRLLEKLNRFEQAEGAPDDINELGVWAMTQWVDEWRSLYWQAFDIVAALTDREQALGAMTPGPNNEPLWQSPLYSVPTAAGSGALGTADPMTDGEQMMLL